MTQLTSYLFAAMFALSGVGHMVRPKFFLALFPQFVPYKIPLIYISGIVELAVAVALLIPATRQLGLWATLGLLLAFTPLHIRDLFIEQPAVGSQGAAIVRMVIQVGMIGLVWFVVRRG